MLLWGLPWLHLLPWLHRLSCLHRLLAMRGRRHRHGNHLHRLPWLATTTHGHEHHHWMLWHALPWHRRRLLALHLYRRVRHRVVRARRSCWHLQNTPCRSPLTLGCIRLSDAVHSLNCCIQGGKQLWRHATEQVCCLSGKRLMRREQQNGTNIFMGAPWMGLLV